MTRPSKEFRVVRASNLPTQLAERAWLVRDIWGHLAVGFIGGQPKSGKTWLALDLAVSVSSGTDCLGRFPVDASGPVLAYLAEDSLPSIRQRLDSLCAHRNISLQAIDLHLVDTPGLRLDADDDKALLVAAVAKLKPRLLILDPLVRLHALDENSAADISALLGWLRALSRTHQLCIAVVHHMSKKSRRQPGQALRGSSDLHAWADSSAYLTRIQDKLTLTLEHRSAAARPPVPLHLVSGVDGSTPHLEPLDDSAAPVASTIRQRVVDALREASAPISRSQLRSTLRVNNHNLGDALAGLERDGVVTRTDAGLSLAPTKPA